MFYVDAQRKVTRRDSSLITTLGADDASIKSAYAKPPSFHSVSVRTGHFSNLPPDKSTASFTAVPEVRPWGTIRNEVTTMLFASMLEHIVDRWDVLEIKKPIEVVEEIPSEPASVPPTIVKKSKLYGKKEFMSVRNLTGKSVTKSRPDFGSSKSRMSHGLAMTPSTVSEVDPLLRSWWNHPDERVIIQFKNGNTYEGNISMKLMHGDGRYQWSDGTVFMGQFKENEIIKGSIQWNDDTWYEGHFAKNIRHGKGLFVDSRSGKYYAGEWDGGTKHGKGKIQFSANNIYDGDWIKNVRHGYGFREYSTTCGYLGQWEWGLQTGKGTMVWPNHDLYRGEWECGRIHGNGYYVWDTFFNNRMVVPALNTYNGNFVKGKRCGKGGLKFGNDLALRYDGEFKDNKKDGQGVLITSYGYILKKDHLFHSDILLLDETEPEKPNVHGLPQSRNIEFSMSPCIGLRYHIEKALGNIDRSYEKRKAIIDCYYENQRESGSCSQIFEKCQLSESSESLKLAELEELKIFEESSLRKAIMNYILELKNIYYYYATLCTTEDITFEPILIRLFLWQFYYDIGIHHKGLTLVQIDDLYYSNKDLNPISPHCPYEKIYMWQFIHSLLLIANALHSKKCLPGPKPDTIMATAFRKFIDEDVLPGARRNSGHFPQEFGKFVPLMSLYELYQTIGEPHTVRDFLRAIYTHPLENKTNDNNEANDENSFLNDVPEEYLPLGTNVSLYNDRVVFITENEVKQYEKTEKLPLYNLERLPQHTVIEIFSELIPRIKQDDLILDLDVQITFYEFFEAIVECIIRLNEIRDKEIEELENAMLAEETPNAK